MGSSERCEPTNGQSSHHTDTHTEKSCSEKLLRHTHQAPWEPPYKSGGGSGWPCGAKTADLGLPHVSQTHGTKCLCPKKLLTGSRTTRLRTRLLFSPPQIDQLKSQPTGAVTAHVLVGFSSSLLTAPVCLFFYIANKIRTTLRLYLFL